MPHLTPQRAYLYDRWVYPWTIRIGAVWILFDAYAPLSPQDGDWMGWLGAWLEIAAIRGIADVGYAFRGEWEEFSVHGWTVFLLWLIGTATLRRVPPLYSWVPHRFLSKRTVVTVTPELIAFHGSRFETEGVGQLAVMQHQELGMETMRDQSRREAGGRPRGKAGYFQNAFEVVMPYHGQPVVVVSIYGTKLAADQVAARITLASQLAMRESMMGESGDEFGPSPSLPNGEAP